MDNELKVLAARMQKQAGILDRLAVSAGIPEIVINDANYNAGLPDDAPSGWHNPNIRHAEMMPAVRQRLAREDFGREWDAEAGQLLDDLAKSEKADYDAQPHRRVIDAVTDAVTGAAGNAVGNVANAVGNVTNAAGSIADTASEAWASPFVRHALLTGGVGAVGGGVLDYLYDGNGVGGALAGGALGVTGGVLQQFAEHNAREELLRSQRAGAV